MWDETPQSVLVIQTAFIGDVVLVIPLLSAIHEAWSSAFLDVMVRPPANNLLETLPFVRQVIVYDKYSAHRGVKGFFNIARRLRSNHYDLTLLPHRSFRSGALAYLTKIPKRVGFKRGGGRFFHTDSVDYPASLHEIERNLTLLKALRIEPRLDLPVVVSAPEDIAEVDRLLESMKSSKIIAFAPSSIWFSKRWLEEYFLELGKQCQQNGFNVLLIGGVDDRTLCDSLRLVLGDGCLSLAGQLTLRQTVTALRRCRLLVSNDSAPTHLGVAAGCKVLTLFGSTTPRFGFGPYGDDNRSFGVDLYCRPCTDHGRQNCPERHFRCMKEMNPELVFDQVWRMLGMEET